jgi:hypothetical protein
VPTSAALVPRSAARITLLSGVAIFLALGITVVVKGIRAAR